MKKKTIRQRILGTLSRQQAKGQKLEINRSVLERTFKKDILFDSDVNNIFMREVRYMAEAGILKRVNRGIYTATTLGKKSI